jgi:two-component system sensor histidine kinase KdpD
MMLGLFGQLFSVSFLVALATALAEAFATSLGMTGTVMLYLLAVLAASYYLPFPMAILSAVSSFLAINYFFVEPRYTFEVADIESWSALLGFLLVSVVVASLVKRLRNQTQRADAARSRAQFAKELAEHLADKHDLQDLLRSSCDLVQKNTGRPIAVAQINDHDQFELIYQAADTSLDVNESAARWVVQNGKVIGPGTVNWPESDMWLVPFSRLPSTLPLLIAGNAHNSSSEDEPAYLRGVTDQIATAYQRLISVERARQSELVARDESIHSALLASLSHDMRTPLTAILGAATTLVQQEKSLEENAQRRLLESICSEAMYLTGATENILSLARLDSNQGANLRVDWQSPEEIVGITLTRYHKRLLPCTLKAEVRGIKALIKADASLISQALANLIDNAIAAHGGDEPIVLEVDASECVVDISVKDRGDGFPQGFDVSQIRKFSHYGRNRKGFGLGLAIVHAIAEAHHIDFIIKAREGGGAITTLRFDTQHIDAYHE